MVETKCIEVDNAQSSNSEANKLNDEQWQALIALHRTLLHKHHDFFLASQHPSASMPLLYETVPAFEDTWIYCLGDLGRYRMAIEDHDQPTLTLIVTMRLCDEFRFVRSSNSSLCF
ncbi:Telomerase-binding protein EST1A [Ilyonectria robusta]